MIKNYFKIALRNLRKNTLYSGINIFGLSVGLAACLLIGIYISHELSYDKFNKNADRVVRLTMEYSFEGTVNKTATTGTEPGPEFKRVFPYIDTYARTYITHNIFSNGDKMFDEPGVLFADNDFFKIFSFKILYGDPATALDAPDKIVLTRSMAKKYFGTDDAVGKTLHAKKKEYRVSAVCEDVPANSQIKFDFATQFLNLGDNVKKETWWTANWITYFLLNNKTDINQFQKDVDVYMKSAGVRTSAGLTGKNYLSYHAEPLLSVHLHSALNGFEPNSNIRYIYMFAIIALLILIIACANYSNLATAQSAGRSGEIGVRKVMGASRKQVFMQFIGESAVLTFISAILALLIAVLLVPYFNKITGKEFTGSSIIRPLPLLLLIGFSILVSLAAGLYPALVLSGTRIMNVLKKGFSFTGGNNFMRKTLVITQFGISVFLIIYTVIILKQMHFMMTKDLGYNKDHIVVLPVTSSMLADFQNTKEAFEHIPGVQGVTASYETPEFVKWGDGITATDEKGNHSVSLNAMPVDLDFTKTMQMQMLAGRDFQQSDFSLLDTSNDYANYQNPYIINEALAQKIGWTPEQAIGKTIKKNVTGPVVGVVKNFNFSSLHDPIGPLLIFLSRDLSRDFMLRINSNNVSQTIASIESVWKQRVTGVPFSYHFLDDDYNKLYQSEQRSSILFGVAASLAIILACLGLFGLAAFTTIQRTKEIGIRRVLGAGVGNITLLVAKNFLLLVAVSILIAIPLAWWAGNQWLQDFAFRVSIGIPVFITAAAVTILIALATVSYHSIRAALTNPVKSLRTE